MKTQNEILTREMIDTLRDEAGDAGDLDMVEICDDALHYEPSHPEWSRDFWMQARRDVAAAISDARAADESKPFVAVVADSADLDKLVMTWPGERVPGFRTCA